MQRMHLLLCGAVLAAGLPAQTNAPKTHLNVGDMAPDFTLPSSSAGKPIKLADYKGKNVLVLAFFPAAFTGGWTKELTAYQAGIAKFEGMDVKVVAVSVDNQPTLNHWAKELDAQFPLASDFSRTVSKEYGVLSERGMANRTTFVIDPDGKIVSIDEGSAAIDPTGAETACKRIKKQ